MKLLITIPCFNEELVLERTVFSVMEYAKQNLSDYEWKVLIIDNNSADDTFRIATDLHGKFSDRIVVKQVSTPGRGVALRTVWLEMEGYDIYSYMDADLATDIKDYSYIVNKVKEGYDLVTGSRYIPYSDVRRDIKRKILSKIYNLLIKLILKVNFKDAQCGFKAFSKKIITELVPVTTDNGWFWDTELMILAETKGYKTLEVPVSWREVRDELRKSKVSHWSESVRQLKNIQTMRKRIKNGVYGKKSL